MGNQPEMEKSSPGKAYKDIRNALENKTKSQDESSQQKPISATSDQVDSELKSDDKAQPRIADKLKKATEEKLSKIWTEKHSDQLRARVHSGYKHAKIVANQTAKTLRDAANSGISDTDQEAPLVEATSTIPDSGSNPDSASKDAPLPPEKTSPSRSGKRSFGIVDGILVALAVVLVVISILAFKSLLTPISAYHSANYDKSRNSGFVQPSPENSAEGKAEQPKIASISVLSLGGGKGDHPELAGKLLDGDPNSFWNSRSFKIPSYPDKAIYLVVKLAKPAPISAVTLTSAAQGGTMQLLDPKSADATTGDILAKATFAQTFTLKLHERLVTDHFTLKIPELPKDKDNHHRAWLSTVSVK